MQIATNKFANQEMQSLHSDKHASLRGVAEPRRGNPDTRNELLRYARNDVNENERNTADDDSQLDHSDLRRSLPKFGYAVSVAGHLAAATAQFSNIFPESIKNSLNKLAPTMTKIVNSANFFAKGADAFNHNRALDSMARMLFPAIVPFMPVEDMYLGAGLGLGLTMMNDSHESRVNDTSDLVANFKESYKAFKEMVVETWQAGFGKDRKILVHKNREKGHSMHTSGIGMFTGSALGLINKILFKDEDSFMHKSLHKISALIRNVFGIWGDIIIMLHPDSNNNKAGVAYITAATLDTLQAVVLPKELRQGVSHLVQSIANVANYFYANTSQARSDGEFVDYA